MVNQDPGAPRPNPNDPLRDPVTRNTTVVKSGPGSGVFIVIGIIVLAVIAYFLFFAGANNTAVAPEAPATTAPAAPGRTCNAARRRACDTAGSRACNASGRRSGGTRDASCSRAGNAARC